MNSQLCGRARSYQNQINMKNLLLLVLLVLSRIAFAQPGAIDLSFNSTDLGFNSGVGSNATVLASAIQPDGKILIGGAFTTYNGTSRSRIARLNPDGILDLSFDPVAGPNNNVQTIAIQSDGKVIIGGSFTSFNGVARGFLARLNTDGALDGTFVPQTGGFSALNDIKTIAIQSDGKIMIGGDFTIARLNTDGTVDATFNSGSGLNADIFSSTLQGDGKIIIGGNFTLYNGQTRNGVARINTDGSLDLTFNPLQGINQGSPGTGNLRTILIQPDGKIIIGGGFSTYNGVPRNTIARINSDGSLDVTFNPGTGASSIIFASSLQGDGKVIVGGMFTSYNGTSRNRIARINTDGSLDGTFDPGTGASNTVFTTTVQTDGKVIIGGDFTTYNGVSRSRIDRLNTNGALDPTFSPISGATASTAGNNLNSTVWKISTQSDGKLVIGGNFLTYNGSLGNRVARLNPDGTLDGAFNPGTGANGTVFTTSIQSDGKVIIGGTFTSFNGTAINRIARLNSDGTLDGIFTPGTGANGDVKVAAVQGDGKIIIGGNFSSYNSIARNRIARINVDGTLDGAFVPAAVAGSLVETIAIQSDGKIIVGGSFTFARLNTDGSIDGTFNKGTGPNGTVSTITLQADGKAIVGGAFTAYNGTGRIRIARINTDGTLDGTFNPGTGANSDVKTVAIQSDGRLIICGYFTSYNGTGRIRIARLNSDGTLDGSFLPGTGAGANIETTALQSDGKAVIGGDFTSYNGTGRNRLARVITGSLPGQTITFGPLATQTYNNAPLKLTATATSGLPVTYISSNTAIATVRGDELTIEGAGSCTITAQQAGNGSFAPAPDVPQTLTVNKANQSFTLNFAGAPRLTGQTFDPQSVSSSGLPVSYASSNGNATVSSGLITTNSVGSSTITLSQAGDANFNAATPSNVTLNIMSSSSPYAFVRQDGSSTGQYTGSGAAVTGIEVDASGKIYIPIPLANQIMVLNADGSFNKVFSRLGINDGEIQGPADIAVDASGNMYVVDRTNHRIQVFNASGVFIRKIGGRGAASGKLSSPGGVALDASGNIYVMESGNNRVSVFNNSGVFQYAFGTPGTGNGQFSGARGIDVDNAGNIYVSDQVNNRVQVFTNNGTFIRTFGTNGSGNGQFFLNKHIKVDGAGNIYVADDGNGRIQKFDNNGNFLSSITPVANAAGLALDGSGNIYATSYFTGQVLKYAPNGTVLQNFSPVPSTPQQVFQPEGVAINATNVFVSTHHQVKVYDYAANHIRTIGSLGSADGQFNRPAGIVADNSGNLYVADWGNQRVQVFDNAGNFVRKIGVGTLNRPFRVALDPGGRLFVSDAQANIVYIYQTDGTLVTSFGSTGTGNGQFQQPNGIAFDAAGNTYVCDYTNKRVQIFNASNAFVIALGTAGTGPGQFNGPTDIKIDPTGNVFVLDELNHNIQVFNSAGAYLYTIGSFNTGLPAEPLGNSHFQFPRHLAITPTGTTLLVADFGHNLIQTFASAPPAPTATAATSISSTGFTANWGAVPEAMNYRLDVSADNFATFVTGYNNKTVAAISDAVTGLTAGTAYKFRVRAVNGVGTSPNSNVISATTLTNAPVAIAATAATTTSFTANWNVVTGATDYRLDVSTDGFSTFVTGYNNKTVSTTNDPVTGLPPGTAFSYRVRAANISGSSANSNVIAATTLTLAPVATAATSIAATTFTANWGAVTGSVDYRLDVSADNFSTFVTGYNNKTVAGLSDPVTGLTAGTAYSYRVRAVNAGGTSANSNTISASTLTVGPIATAATVVTTTSFTANWNTVAGAVDYRLDVSTDNFSTFVTGYNNKTVAGLSDPVTGLTAGTAYSYRVRAVNAGGTSANSNVIAVTTVPSAPVATAATSVSTTTFTANWGAVTGAVDYRLDVSADGFATFVPGFNNKTVSATNDAVSGLIAGTAYSYRVRAVNTGGTSANSNVTSVTTAPPAPVAIAASAVTTTGFTANWNASTGATSYRLDVSGDNFATFVAGYNNKTVSITSDPVTGLSAGTVYSYRVRAVNASGISGNSNVISVTTAPAAPVATAATSVTSTGFTANWGSVTGAVDYRLDVSADGFATFVSGYNNKAVSATTDAVSGLTAGSIYSYRVRAVNTGGTSASSNVVAATTAPTSPVASAATSISTTGFTANWGSVTGAASYRLDVSADNFATFVTGFNNKTVATTNDAVGGLTAGTAYSYRVRAVNAGGTSSNSNVISVTTTPAAPVANTATNILATSFTANWTAPAGAADYRLDVSADNFATFITGYDNKTVSTTSDPVNGLMANTAYKFRVRAVNTGGTSVNSNVISVTTVSIQNQTITFAALPDRTLGDPAFALTATASSGLAVIYESVTTAKVSISGSTATLTAAGSATIRAKQNGDSNFNPATDVDRTFCINPAKPVITVTGANTEGPVLTSSNSAGNQWFKDGTQMAGATNATLTITGPGIYTVQTTVESCASAISEPQPMIATGDVQVNEVLHLSAYPNPVRTNLRIDLSAFETQMPVDISVSDIAGKSVGRATGIGGSQITLDVSSYSDGMFILRASQNGKVRQLKFVKE